MKLNRVTKGHYCATVPTILEFEGVGHEENVTVDVEHIKDQWVLNIFLATSVTSLVLYDRVSRTKADVVQRAEVCIKQGFRYHKGVGYFVRG